MNSVDIIIPVYNEEDTIESVLEVVDNTDFCALQKNIIIVDDCSIDSTRKILEKYENKFKIIYKDKNSGKGSALSEGIKHSNGDIIVFQDADLEYDPNDYSKLISLIVHGDADVVYGSRFLNKKNNNFMMLSFLANKFLTMLTNILYNSNLTDMETCYKAIRRDCIKDITLVSKKFDIEPEITSKLLKKGIKISEVPICYNSRNYSSGKKITFLDGLMAIYTLLKYKFTN